MNKKAKIIASSIAAIALSSSLIAGSTYALFTSESKVNVAVTSAKVNVSATAGNLSGQFNNGGYAEIVGNNVVVNNLTPGDSVAFDITVTNYSTIDVKYNTEIEGANDELFKALKIVVDEAEYTGNVSYKTYYTMIPAAQDTVNGDTVKTISIQISLPEDYTGVVTDGEENAVQGVTTNITFKVNAIQGNASVESAPLDTDSFADGAEIDLKGDVTKYGKSGTAEVHGDFTMKNGTFVSEQTYGGLDFRPSDDKEKTVVLFENMHFRNDHVTNPQYGGSSYFTSELVKGTLNTGDDLEIKFVNCTFENTTFKLGGSSSAEWGIFDATFENCTFDNFGYNSAIEIANYLNGKLTVKDCTFKQTATGGVSIVSLAKQTDVEVVSSGNTIIAKAAVKGEVVKGITVQSRAEDATYVRPGALTEGVQVTYYASTTEQAQAVLDKAKDNVTLVLTKGEYGALKLGQSKDASEILEGRKNYKRTVNNLTVIGEGDVTVDGFGISVGNFTGSATNKFPDPVTGEIIDSNNNSYHGYFDITNLRLEHLNLTKSVDIAADQSDMLNLDGLTIYDCHMTGTLQGSISNYAVDNVRSNKLLYYAGGANLAKNIVVENCTVRNAFQGVYTYGNRDITVKNCKFYTIGHNAIAIQNGSTNNGANLHNIGTIVIEGNTIDNSEHKIGTDGKEYKDRAIRIGDFQEGSITINGNTFINAYDADGEVIKASSAFDGAIILEDNTVDGNTLVLNGLVARK